VVGAGEEDGGGVKCGVVQEGGDDEEVGGGGDRDGAAGAGGCDGLRGECLHSAPKGFAALSLDAGEVGLLSFVVAIEG